MLIVPYLAIFCCLKPVSKRFHWILQFHGILALPLLDPCVQPFFSPFLVFLGHLAGIMTIICGFLSNKL